MPVHPPQATGGYNSFTVETKPAEERKEGGETKGEETKGAQCSGWHPPFQESGYENRAVNRRIHAKATEGGSSQKGGHEYEEQLRMKQTVTVSLSFVPTRDASAAGGAQDISPIDDASWEVIDYPSGPV
jgi:hypothetical protein